jgi:hypothetical protein
MKKTLMVIIDLLELFRLITIIPLGILLIAFLLSLLGYLLKNEDMTHETIWFISIVVTHFGSIFLRRYLIKKCY